MDIYADFLNVPTGNICDVNDFNGAMDPSIKPLDRAMSFCGRARTVACAAGDNLTLHQAVLMAKPGDVLVVSCGGYSQAGIFGEMLAISCRVRGIRGVVIDGGCRDKNALIEMGFPVFVRALSPEGSTKNTLGAIDSVLKCGGVKVEAGDVIVGDCDGVVVIAKSDAATVLEKALAKKKKEEEMRPLLEAGTSIPELLNFLEKLNWKERVNEQIPR